MTDSSSRIVTTNQTGIHDDLIETLLKHLGSDFHKPVAEHSQIAFDVCCDLISANERGIILDSGCGIGQSTKILAEKYPDNWVIGVDQSEHRLNKISQQLPDNCQFIRADLIDFWRLALQARWKLEQHYILYPNPWPKAKHLKRRWHGHPLMPTILNLGGELILRSNWDLYVLEFATVLDYLSYPAREIQAIEPEFFLTPFEKKYYESGQTLYELKAELS
mgnify:CR=1 FL=1